LKGFQRSDDFCLGQKCATWVLAECQPLGQQKADMWAEGS